MSLNFIWRNDKWYNKRVLIWRFTLVLVKINYGQIGDQTELFYTTNPVFYTSGNRFVRRTSTFGNLWFFHLSHRTTVIQDLLVRRQFSLVPDNRTNVNVEAWTLLKNYSLALNNYDSLTQCMTSCYFEVSKLLSQQITINSVLSIYFIG